MKLLVVALVILGLTLVLNGVYRQNLQCPPPKIVYKYIPRSPAEELDNPVKVSDIFNKMFSEPDPLVYGL